MFDLFGGVFSKFTKSWFGSQVDTWVDKINRNVSVMLLIAMALLVSAKQYVGEPIHCRHQAVHDGNFEKYMNNICWVTNTYVVQDDESINSKGLSAFEHQRINYYQWVPLVLLIQALMFYLPHLVWQAFIRKSGLDLVSILGTGKEVIISDGREERQKKLKYMATQLDSYLRHYQDMGDNMYTKVRAKFGEMCSCLCGKRGGSFIVMLYIFHKMLYFANIIGQIFILDSFLSSGIHGYSLEALSSILGHKPWPQSRIFPTNTMCGFKLRSLGDQIHNHIVQCVLSINFFHEKVYIAIWMWFIIVAVLTGISLFYWLLRFLFRVDRVRFIKRHLRAMDRIVAHSDKALAYKFVERYLRHDGVFTIRLINMNVSGMVAAQTVAELWDQFKRSPGKHMDNDERVDTV